MTHTLKPTAAAIALMLLTTGLWGQKPAPQPTPNPKLPEVPGEATAYSTENALGGLTFTAPICVTSAPGEKHRLFVAERGGAIHVVTGLAAKPAKSVYLDLNRHLPEGHTLRFDSENGLLGLAFHPRFASNGEFFVFYSFDIEEAGMKKLFQRVARIKVKHPAADAAEEPEHTPLISQFDEAGNHNGGDLAFGPDGFLYFSMGDEGGGNDKFDNARHIDRDFFGGIFRIDVDLMAESIGPNPHSQAAQSAAFPTAVHAGTYKVPADNPFIGVNSWHGRELSSGRVRTETWATGLRNVWRMAFDRATGRLFAGDVGQVTEEEIDIIVKGGDYGWSWREGALPFALCPPPVEPPADGFDPIEPIFVYDRILDGKGSDAVLFGLSVTGGEVCHGGRLPELKGAYLFADYLTGYIVALREGTDGKWTAQRLANDNLIVDFGADPRNGDLLFCDIVDGQVKRLVKNLPPNR